MVSWLEISLITDGEAAEAAADFLQQYAHQGVVIESAPDDLDSWTDDVEAALAGHMLRVKAYLPVDESLEAKRAQIEQGLWYLSRLYPPLPHRPTYRVVEEENWAEAWKVHYKPVRVGRRIVIRPLWQEVDADRLDVVIALDPGMAFGTGTHPSTQLCLMALEDYLQAGDSVLDLGAGSGILSIAAVKLGAREALALDIDPVAVQTCAANAQANQVGARVASEPGSLAEAQAVGRTWAVVVVNILAQVILSFAGAGLETVVRPGGVLVAAGIIEEQADEVRAALAEIGLPVVATRQIKDWVGLICRRSPA